MSEKIHDVPKRHGGDHRGSSYTRRKRGDWLASPEGGFGGTGSEVPCVHCGNWTARSEMHQDRIFPGEGYNRDNLQPSCPSCNQSRSNKTDWVGPLNQMQFRMA